MLRLILLGVITFVILKATTFGWQGFRKESLALPKDKELIERLKTHIVKLSSDIGERSVFKFDKLAQAADYISEQFKESGFEVEEQEYAVYGKTAKNIIAKKTGVKTPNEVIIIGAHYDTCFNPGANDNASGVSALLELARFVSSKNTGCTIKFIAFVNEEPPFFKTEDMGSFVYARQARENGEDIKLAVSLEAIGYYSDKPFSQRYPLFLGLFYPNRANFIAVVGNWTMRQKVNEFTHLFSQHSSFPIYSTVLPDFIPGVDFSDQWSFWQMGFPAIMVTDTAFYRYPYYHRDSDTFEKLDYNKLAVVVEGLYGVLYELAER